MRIDYLKEILGMYPDDMDVFIQTVPDDLCQPVTVKQISLMKACIDDRRGGCLEPAKLLFTAYHPTEDCVRPAKSRAQRAALADLVQDIERAINPVESGTLSHAKEALA